MVTPVDKNNTDIFGLFNLANQLVQHNQSATSGDSLTYTTSQGFGNTEGAPYVSQYIADRTPSGWSKRSSPRRRGSAARTRASGSTSNSRHSRPTSARAS